MVAWHYLRRLARRLLIATLIVAGALCGVAVVLLGAAAIIRSVRESKLDVTTGELMEQPRVVARADEPLHDIAARMAMENVDRCPVIAPDGSKHVVGFMSPADLVRARFRLQQAGVERADITLF